MHFANLAAHVLIEELCRQGAQYFCLAPGSRSTPLVYEIAQNKKVTDFVFYDERALAFHALGYGKAKKKPAVIVITSGTALANLYPAVIEAQFTQTPMIILSADRPIELYDCGANQTINQVHFFQSYVQWSSDLALCDEKLSSWFLASTASYAYQKAASGPVHLNCRFREPFLMEQKVEDEKEFLNWQKKASPHNQFISTSDKVEPIQLNLSPNGIIILGKETKHQDLTEIKQLAQKLQYPIFSDILAPSDSILAPFQIHNFDALLKMSHNLPVVESILQFGQTYLSSSLLKATKKWPLKDFIFISPHEKRSDPNHLPSKTYLAEAKAFCQSVQISKSYSPNLNWLELWKNLDKDISAKKQVFFDEEQELSEPYFFNALANHLRSDNLLFISSSLPIRDAQTSCITKNHPQIFANRGASGIDGNLATAFGISQALNQKITIVVGDATFLYDLNALGQIKDLKHPPTIYIINNFGCGIFKMLPIASKQEIFDRYFLNPHSYNFQGAAKQFDCDYQCVTSIDQLDVILTTKMLKPTLVEIQVDAEKSFLVRKKIQEQLDAALV